MKWNGRRKWASSFPDEIGPIIKSKAILGHLGIWKDGSPKTVPIARWRRVTSASDSAICGRDNLASEFKLRISQCDCDRLNSEQDHEGVDPIKVEVGEITQEDKVSNEVLHRPFARF